jgi:hypothetical protein
MLRKFLLFACGLLLATGCERRRDTQPIAVVDDDPEYVVAVLVDLSGSFLDKITEGGHAHDFLLALIDRYFRDRIGTNDQIILAQISATPDRALLWQGSPLELRKAFPNPRAFADFLRSQADPQGSEVHNALAQTVEYVMTQPSVSNRKAKSAVFAMSDLHDTSSEPVVSRNRAIDVLCEYGKLGGTVCLYFVDQTLVPVWQRELKKTGLEFTVASEIRRPTLPSFD